MSLSCDVIKHLAGKTISTAESLTGGGIGAALTAVPGSSAIYKGGVISYTDEIKANILSVHPTLLKNHGAVSASVAEEMVKGVRKLLNTDIAVSVTGLAGPSGDSFGNPVGTVYVGYQDCQRTVVQHFCFDGERDAVRAQTIDAAMKLILQFNS